MKPKTSPPNIGKIVSIRGSVVDIGFDIHLPPIYTLLHADEGRISIEVLEQLDAHRVLGIALTPTQGLARGMAVEDTGGPLKVPAGKGCLSRMFDVFGNIAPVFVPGQIAVLLALSARIFDEIPLDLMEGAEQAIRKAATQPPARVRERLHTVEHLNTKDRQAIIATTGHTVAAKSY